ncbi:MAG TPA: hypothetical protein VF276_15950 [Chloroflexia bacterium]
MKKLIIILGVFVLFAGITVAGAASNPLSLHQGPVPPTPIGATIPSTGPVKQRPLPQTPHDPAAWGAPAITPPVTEARVRDYFAQRPPVFPGMSPLQPPTLTAVEFMTVAQLRQRLGVPNDLSYYSGTAQIVYVSFTGKVGVDQADPNKPQAPYGQTYMVFDATTGNVLIGP